MVDGLVSIIMPSWNTGRFIGESIQSVLSQTYKNWELIIVDDCSTDNTDEIVASFNDERIRYFRNDKNSGAALTRNKAMREARGEWIAFLDSDDLWMPEKLEKQISFMKENGYTFSFTEYEKIDEESKPLNIYVSGPEKVNKRQMYNYDYIGQLTMMYSAKQYGCGHVEAPPSLSYNLLSVCDAEASRRLYDQRQGCISDYSKCIRRNEGGRCRHIQMRQAQPRRTFSQKRFQQKGRKTHLRQQLRRESAWE